MIRTVLLLVFLISFMAFSQEKTELQLEIIGQSSTSVMQNGRLELGFVLPDDIMHSIQEYLEGKPHERTGLNPFVSWDIDIQADFQHLSKNISFTSIGFWYTEMKRNVEENKWDEVETKLPFRVRYAPTETGEWEMKLRVFIKGKPTFTSAPFKFEVVPSRNNGHVTLNEENQYLERDGENIIPIGVNLPFPYNNNNMIYSTDKEETLNVDAWEEYSDLVNEYLGKGGKYFRLLFHPSAMDIEFEEVGYYGSRQSFAWEFDKIMEACERNNALMQFNLMYHSFFMKLGDYFQYRFDYTDYWHDENVWPYADPNEISGYSRILNSKTPSDMFLNPLGMKYLKERTRYIMARWGYSTSISILELLCEPWHMDENAYTHDVPYDALTPEGDRARKAVYEYHKQISSYILDTLGYKQHLLGAVGRFPVGKTAIYSHLTEEDPEFIDSTWYLDNIDVISISYYASNPDKLIASKSGKNNECSDGENSMACTIERLRETYGKPVIFGESDHGDDTYLCSDYQSHQLDVLRYPFTGAIGHYIWAAFIIDDTTKASASRRDERIAWPGIIEVANYYNTEEFYNLIREGKVLGRQKRSFQRSAKDLLETQYIVNADASFAGGYLYNRTYNINTIAGLSTEEIEDSPCNLHNDDFTSVTEISWKPQKLKVEGLQSFKKYRVNYYSYKHRDFLYQAETRSSVGGKLKLTHPTLTPVTDGDPLIIYRIELVD